MFLYKLKDFTKYVNKFTLLRCENKAKVIQNITETSL